MYISKKDREFIKNKFGGRCAYSGTILEDDWQVDHINPVIRSRGIVERIQNHNLDNMVPVQKIINHYKRDISLDSFRNWLLGELHLRLSKFPKKSKSEKTLKRKEYLSKVASYFEITEENPFDRIFYFEKF